MSVIVCGDVLGVLRGLLDEQFNCCVTSPPYWGLRDYGTAKWSGGLPDCDHRNHHGEQGSTGQRADRTFTGAQNFYRDECRKCGAVRTDRQIGLERTPEEYVARLVEVFREVRRVLRDDGTLWLNLGDSYAATTKGSAGHNAKQDSNAGSWHGERGWQIPSGLKPKDLVGIPWRVAFALQADGWYLRSDIIWHKPNPMPESVTDRPTKAHEYLFLLAKSEKYYYNAEAIAEPATYAGKTVTLGEKSLSRGQANGANVKPSGNGNATSVLVRDTRNRRSVWSIQTQPYPEAHFATFPEDLVRPCILAGCPQGGSVLDPFAGSGTTLAVAKALGCAGVGIELNPEYCKLAEKRLAQEVLALEPALRERTDSDLIEGL